MPFKDLPEYTTHHDKDACYKCPKCHAHCQSDICDECICKTAKDVAEDIKNVLFKLK